MWQLGISALNDWYARLAQDEHEVDQDNLVAIRHTPSDKEAINSNMILFKVVVHCRHYMSLVGKK